MFKRVEKRRLKKQEEEELGLDEDMKDVLGMHDTDSDESDTDSDDTSSGEHSEGEDGEEEQEEFGSDAEGSQEEDARSESDAEEEPVITIREALRDPVYVVSLQPIVKACIVCPGKLLKGVQMIDLHRKSNAHARRVKQFEKLAMDISPTDNAWDVLRQNAEEKPKPLLTPSENSKRAEKRKAQAAVRKAKRDKQKARAKAKKAVGNAPAPEAASPSPVKPLRKKPKIDTTAPEVLVLSIKASPTAETEDATARSIKSIVRSTSERAKQARARAVDGTRPGYPPKSTLAKKKRKNPVRVS